MRAKILVLSMLVSLVGGGCTSKTPPASPQQVPPAARPVEEEFKPQKMPIRLVSQEKQRLEQFLESLHQPEKEMGTNAIGTAAMADHPGAAGAEK